ncbi:ATP-binding protein [Morganella morganii]|nr:MULTISPECIES: ATP-binding protein [Morganella]SSN06859.1 histidine kinase [Klebsiella pneumoniae]EJD6110452.1 ATP-binding protein [Morganella morganii]EJG2207088.1 ATP-binding protein [Morganella morganii]EKU4017564.1 ATP-binding protein [Morganella morganii]ELA7700292.1 ATP-binding protein [Morganella morganii]
MDALQFNVSARAAILIGRENIANSEGAIIELVKNSYDADSDFSIILIDNKFTTLPEIILLDDYNSIKKICSQEFFKVIENLYKYSDAGYIYKGEKPLYDNSMKEVEQRFISELKPLSALYIIDNGSGMSAETIRENWMTIGTANKKNIAITSDKKRVKSGAKGIGRFALDKLGKKCDLISIDKKNKGSAVHWSVDWSQFENPNATIDQIKATLESLNLDNLNDGLDYLHGNQSSRKNINKILGEIEKLTSTKYAWINNRDYLRNGTIIKVTGLHDNWNDKFVKGLFNKLAVLVPPAEINDFSIHILPALNTNNFGEVLTSYCEDFDYKIVAEGDDFGKVNVTVYREEYDIEIIPDSFFNRPKLKNSKYYNKNVFLEKKYTKVIDVQKELGDRVDNELIKKLGNFEFILYYLKKTVSNDLKDVFYNKKINSSARKEWLDSFSGIKIYRDGFRVRPYGEIAGPAYDWLGLGRRKAASPAGISKPGGGYRIEPDNISGIVKISRLTNPDFDDKSSREGLQESESFMIFQNLLIEIISILEKDRAFIASEFRNFDNEINGPKRDLEKARKLAEEVNKNKSEKAKETQSDEENKDVTILANLVEYQTEEIEQLKDEQKMLRAMASSGIVSAALSHDVEKIRGRLAEYADDIKENISEFIDENQNFDDDIFNPYITIQQLKKDNDKIFTWLGFSLEFIKKDKRKRKELSIVDYFDRLYKNWKTTLDARGIELIINIPEYLSIRAFEVDFDSIFINLFTNTIEAFDLPNQNLVRRITISAEEFSSILQITYQDTGPGISSAIDEQNDIFEPQVTTKKDEYGNIVGTGLGMWIIKKTVEEYAGKSIILKNIGESGFGIRFELPMRKSNSGKQQ